MADSLGRWRPCDTHRALSALMLPALAWRLCRGADHRALGRALGPRQPASGGDAGVPVPARGGQRGRGRRGAGPRGAGAGGPGAPPAWAQLGATAVPAACPAPGGAKRGLLLRWDWVVGCCGARLLWCCGVGLLPRWGERRGVGPQVEAQSRMEACGQSCVGWYHSHPVFEPSPSRKDMENQVRAPQGRAWQAQRRVQGEARSVRAHSFDVGVTHSRAEAPLPPRTRPASSPAAQLPGALPVRGQALLHAGRVRCARGSRASAPGPAAQQRWQLHTA